MAAMADGEDVLDALLRTASASVAAADKPALSTRNGVVSRLK